TTQNALAVLVGRFPGHIDAGSLDALPPAVKEFGAGIPGELLEQRPDLRAALLRLKAADQQVGAAFAAHFPQIRIGGSLGYQLEPASGFVWNLFAGLVAPLFEQVSINAQYNESKAKLRESVALFKKTLLNAVKEVEDALATGHATAKRIKWLQERVLAAEGALRLSTDQYTQGLTIYLNVLTAEQALLQARTELIAARRELIAARVSLARALGGAWMDADRRACLTGTRPWRSLDGRGPSPTSGQEQESDRTIDGR
ncbi:MAG: TolC family protein, partial [Deltaproteobacteria bacterium]|nr:TolC family protein [Deltaproteobacteria bacterium]